MAQTLVQRAADTAVFLVEHLDASVFQPILLQHVRGAIGRAIVDHYRFPVGIRLCNEAVQGCTHVLRLVISGDNNAEERRTCVHDSSLSKLGKDTQAQS